MLIKFPISYLYIYIFYYYHFFKSPVLAAAPDNSFLESSYRFLSSSRVSAPIFPNSLSARTSSYFLSVTLIPPFSFFYVYLSIVPLISTILMITIYYILYLPIIASIIIYL